MERNWAGTHTYAAERLHRPTTLAEVRETIVGAQRIRVLGSRHSFSDIADSAELLSLEALPADVVVDRAANTISFGAGLTYEQLAEALRTEELALHNMASLPHISVAGAIATATHGSGDRNGNLATAVAALQLVTSNGEVLAFERGDPDFEGVVVGLGALGAVTRLTLDVQPAYRVRQRVFEGLRWDALLDHLEAVMSSGDSVSVFTRWGEAVDQVWVKSRVTGDAEETRSELFGAVAATVERNPLLGLDAVNCSPQLGAPGLWSDHLGHFRAGYTPSRGEEIQSEYFVARRHARAAIGALRSLASAMRPQLLVGEIRTTASDRLWLSPQYDQDTFAFHFTWKREPAAVVRALARIETALAPFGARPHWGKLFLAGAPAIADRYDRLPDFRGLAERLDPRGAFRNTWLERHVVGEP